MSEEGTPAGSAVPIAASLAEFTDELVARRGVEQSNLLFGGQIGPAKRALSARTNSIGVGDPAPDFSLPTAEAGMWRLAEHLAQDPHVPDRGGQEPRGVAEGHGRDVGREPEIRVEHGAHRLERVAGRLGRLELVLPGQEQEHCSEEDRDRERDSLTVDELDPERGDH